MNLLINIFLNLIMIYKLIILVRIIMSWIQIDPYENSLVRFICEITDPVLDGARRAFPFLAMGGIDFSPILVFFALHLLEKVLRGGVM
ncbi:YggT family protein [bacterium]|nr:YggT family protein [bacterium]